MPFFKQLVNQLDNVLHVFSGFGFLRCFANPQPLHITIVGFDVCGRYLLPWYSQLIRTVDDFVVDVRKVSHVLHSVPAEPQVIPYDVKDERTAGMAEVRIIVHRDATGVHSDSLRLQWLEDFLPPGQSVEDLQHASAFHAKAPIKGTKTQSPKSLTTSCPPCFTPTCSRCTWRSPTGMTSRPPSRNCSTSNGGTLGDPAATRMASNGAASPPPQVPSPILIATFPEPIPSSPSRAWRASDFTRSME